MFRCSVWSHYQFPAPARLRALQFVRCGRAASDPTGDKMKLALPRCLHFFSLVLLTMTWCAQSHAEPIPLERAMEMVAERVKRTREETWEERGERDAAAAEQRRGVAQPGQGVPLLHGHQQCAGARRDPACGIRGGRFPARRAAPARARAGRPLSIVPSRNKSRGPGDCSRSTPIQTRRDPSGLAGGSGISRPPTRRRSLPAGAVPPIRRAVIPPCFTRSGLRRSVGGSSCAKTGRAARTHASAAQRKRLRTQSIRRSLIERAAGPPIHRGP